MSSTFSGLSCTGVALARIAALQQLSDLVLRWLFQDLRKLSWQMRVNSTMTESLWQSRYVHRLLIMRKENFTSSPCSTRIETEILTNLSVWLSWSPLATFSCRREVRQGIPQCQSYSDLWLWGHVKPHSPIRAAQLQQHWVREGLVL